MSCCRERNKQIDDVLVVVACESRDAALEFGDKAWMADVLEPFTPVRVGALEVGSWPDDDNGGIIKLNEQVEGKKGGLPENTDLEYGITLTGSDFHGLTVVDGRFGAIVSGRAHYAEKSVDPTLPNLGNEDAKEPETSQLPATEPEPSDALHGE